MDRKSNNTMRFEKAKLSVYASQQAFTTDLKVDAEACSIGRAIASSNLLYVANS